MNIARCTENRDSLAIAAQTRLAKNASGGTIDYSN